MSIRSLWMAPYFACKSGSLHTKKTVKGYYYNKSSLGSWKKLAFKGVIEFDASGKIILEWAKQWNKWHWKYLQWAEEVRLFIWHQYLNLIWWQNIWSNQLFSPSRVMFSFKFVFFLQISFWSRSIPNVSNRVLPKSNLWRRADWFSACEVSEKKFMSTRRWRDERS